MGRNKGIIVYSATIEPKAGGALDARTNVAYRDDLTAAATWEDNNGNKFIYNGMTVVVNNDGDKNGIYILLDKGNYTSLSSWKFIGGQTIIEVRSTDPENPVLGQMWMLDE